MSSNLNHFLYSGLLRGLSELVVLEVGSASRIEGSTPSNCIFVMRFSRGIPMSSNLNHFLYSGLLRGLSELVVLGVGSTTADSDFNIVGTSFFGVKTIAGP